MPDIIKISELDEALALADAAEFPYYQDNGGQNTTYKAPMTQIGAKIVEGLTYQGINLPAGAGNKTVENSLNYLLNAVGGDPNGNISDSYDPTAKYVKGDLCIYENVLYICTAPTTGTFDPTKWTATTIAKVIGSISQLTTTEKSSLVGAVKEVDGRTEPTTVTPTFNSSQSNYSIPFNNTRVYKIGNIVYFTSTIQADNPYGSNPGQDVYSGMPKPYANENLHMGFCAWNVTSNNMRVIVTHDGKLQCRGGNTGTAYDITFSYLCQ